jgi:hypothetical protein
MEKAGWRAGAMRGRRPRLQTEKDETDKKSGDAA